MHIRVLALLFVVIAAVSLPVQSISSNLRERTPANLAQFSLPGILGGAKDLIVKQALSSFGKFLGHQLPVVVSPDDAFPTTPDLPGSPFNPNHRAPMVARLLDDSQDGTVPLSPGDYSFVVDVFCMRAHAGSPPAHSYLVAALRGSAADIITALNSRLPSFMLDHHAVQVLSWNIQAGLPYQSMQPPQREIVDKVIPDYRDRLSGDVLKRIRDQYAEIAKRIPGMPSYSEALERLGPVAEAVTTLQTLRDELGQPAPSYSQLAHSLVPEPLTGVTKVSNQSDTPWSQYSNRVFVRFVTAGNYATPGTYQVRVLQATGGGDVSGAANVPFANIVNNPGEATVQPLTQAPDEHPCDDPKLRDSYDRREPNYHHYYHKDPICDKSQYITCTREAIYLLMTSHIGFMAPYSKESVLSADSASETPPIVDCEPVNLVGLLTSNPVKVELDPASFTATNYTLPGHIFANPDGTEGGFVERQAVEDGVAVYIATTGEGIGPNRDFNLFMGPDLWEEIDSNISKYFAEHNQGFTRPGM